MQLRPGSFLDVPGQVVIKAGQPRFQFTVNDGVHRCLHRHIGSGFQCRDQ